MPNTSNQETKPRLLITSGPTYEPIDAVRFIGNRSSGRLGAALADAAADRGWTVTALTGCHAHQPKHPGVRTKSFMTTADLQSLLTVEVPVTDILIMAAAVADFRPALAPGQLETKIRRSAAGLSIDLEPTPDLLAGCAAMRQPHHVFVGFALEPEADLLRSARSKLERKNIDLVVANPLETMDAPDIRALLVGRSGSPFAEPVSTPGSMSKSDFAPWLLDRIQSLYPTHHAERAHA
jgi:phosphopantothenoylcysteine decarboxylase/phosphopantothenate--cysteine ligase